MTRARRAEIIEYLSKRYEGAERVAISRSGEILATVGRMPNTNDSGRIYVGTVEEVLRDMDPTPDVRSAAQILGARGGSAGRGQSKARAVDYRELARLSHQKRRENKAKKQG